MWYTSIAIPYVGEGDHLVAVIIMAWLLSYNCTLQLYGRCEEFVTKMIEAIRKIDPGESLSESLTGKHITYVLSRQSIRSEPN